MTPEAAKLIGAGLSATIHINNELVHHRTLVEIPPGFPVVKLLVSWRSSSESFPKNRGIVAS